MSLWQVYDLFVIFIILLSYSKIFIMESAQPNLEKLYERLTMAEEEEEDNGIGDVEEHEKKESFSLVGRFLTEKNINFQ